MGRPTRPLHDAGNHGTFERRSLRQAARRGRLTTRPDLPETWSGPALLHHAEGHDPRPWPEDADRYPSDPRHFGPLHGPPIAPTHSCNRPTASQPKLNGLVGALKH